MYCDPAPAGNVRRFFVQRGAVTNPAVFWPGTLGILFLAAGLFTYRRDFQTSSGDSAFGLTAFGPVFIAAALAAFAGEHFTIAPTLAQMVPKFMPGRLFIAYFVGVAHLAAALSFVARRYVRWSSLGVALMFALFVLLMDLPGAVSRPTILLFWILAARQATFAIGALALFAIATRDGQPGRAATLATVARIWTAAVLVFYGVAHILHPQFAPGVPSTTPTQPWVPLPTAIAYAIGILLVAFGLAMFVEKYAAAAAARCGLLMTALTAALYAPQWVMARGASEQIVAINFVFDTLLFAGTVLVISRAISETSR
jgi:uncharacterized membrane protein